MTAPMTGSGGGGRAPPPVSKPAKGGKKAKAAKAAQAAEGNALGCKACGLVFPSKSKLFAHLKENPSHAALKR